MPSQAESGWLTWSLNRKVINGAVGSGLVRTLASWSWEEIKRIWISFYWRAYTDRAHLSAIRSVYTDGILPSVYTDRIADRRYSFFGKFQRCDDVDYFQLILSTELPRDSNRDSRTVTWHFHWRNHWRVYRQNVSVGDSIGQSHYIPTLPTLSSSVSPSSSPSSSPSHLSPPKLQPTTHPNSPLFSTQALKFLIPCTWSQYPFLVDFIIFL